MPEHIEDRYGEPKKLSDIIQDSVAIMKQKQALEKQKKSTKKFIKKVLTMVNLFAKYYTTLQNMHKEIQKYMFAFEHICHQAEEDFNYMQKKFESIGTQNALIIKNKNMIDIFSEQIKKYEELFQKKANEITRYSTALYNLDHIDNPQKTRDGMNTFIVNLLCDADTLLENWNAFHENIQKKSDLI